MAPLAETAAAPPQPMRGADPIECDIAYGRVALVAPPGLFRDSFAHLMATCINDIRLQCSDDVEDVAPGPARLGLIALDPSAYSREALRARIDALRARCDGASIGLVTPDERAASAAGLGALGAAGVVSLSAGMEVAVAAIRLMSVGGYCLPPEFADAAEPSAMQAVRRGPTPFAFEPRPQAAPAAFRDDLTARERDVLRSLREGNQNKTIAFELGISESTVKVHLRNIMKKLNASNRTQAALGGPVDFDRYAARARPVDPARGEESVARALARAGEARFETRLPL